MRAVSLGIERFARSKWGRAVVFGLVVCAMVLGLSLAPAGAITAKAVASTPVESVKAACTTYTNIRAVDEGGGSVSNRNYYLYVYGTTIGGGTTYVWQMIYLGGKPAWGWMQTSFVAVGLADKDRALKIGVSTKWAYANPGWQNRIYKYVRC